LSPFGDRSLIESAYSSFKQRTKASFNAITANPLSRSERFKRPLLYWETIHKAIHTVPQQFKEVSLSCHFQLMNEKAYNSDQIVIV